MYHLQSLLCEKIILKVRLVYFVLGMVRDRCIFVGATHAHFKRTRLLK